MRLIRFLAVGLLALGWPVLAAAAVIQGQGSTFIMTYHSVYPVDHQTVMNQAAQFWADIVRSSVPIEVYVDAGNKTCSQTYNVQVKTVPPASAINFPQAPQADTYYPIALANSLAGTDLQPSAVDIGIAFNARMITRTACQKWYLGYDADYNYNQYSLYFETLQELAHGLGLIPLANLSTGERLNGQTDTYLNQLKSSITGHALADMTGAEIRAIAQQGSDLAFAGAESWAAASGLGFGRTDDALLLFTRSYAMPELTGLHLHDSTRPKQLMMVDLHDAIPETDLAVAMLEDIGWLTTRNDPPQITGQLNVTVLEDQPYSLSLADLLLVDEAPDSLNLAVAPGDHYSLSQQTIVPEANFTGTLTIPVTVSDAEYTSASFDFLLSVSPVNDAPYLTGQNSLSLLEDQSLTLTLADFQYSDIDSSQFSLVLGVGSHYSLNQNTLVPEADYAGTLEVPVQISDGALLSAVLMANVTVSAVNDAPRLTGQNSLSLLEDQSLTLKLADFQYSDIDSSQFSLVLGVGSHYSLNQNTLVPEADYAGTLDVPVQISDGALLSAVLMARVTVSPVNDAPVINAIAALSMLEDGSLTLSSADLTIVDPDSQTFSLILANGSHYQLSGTQIKPDPDWSGELVVPVRVSDGQALSESVSAHLQVLPVNDVPAITAQVAVDLLEDSALQLAVDLLTISDPDSNSFSLSAQPGNHYSLVGTGLTPDLDYNGPLSVPVSVSDGALTSVLFNLQINVLAQNDAPILTGHGPIQIDEDQPLTLSPDLLTFSDSDSSSFDLIAQPGAHYDLVGDQLIPEADFFGSLTVAMQISDRVALSNSLLVTIEVLPINDVPQIQSVALQSATEDQAFAIVLSDLRIVDPDSSDFELMINPGEHYLWGNGQIVPELDYAGDLAISIQVRDGRSTSLAYLAIVPVLAVNDAPVVTGQVVLQLEEDGELLLETLQEQVLASPLLSVSDVDSTAFSLVLWAGDHYQLSADRLIPELDFADSLRVPMQISDGQLLSAVFQAQIDILPVNDAPRLLDIVPQTIDEDGSLFVTQALLSLSDPDSSDFSLSIERGEHYQVAANEIIPDANWFGSLSIDLTLSDGELSSNSLPLLLTVAAVNDLPELTGPALPNGQIYRDLDVRLNGFDLDGDALSFSLRHTPDWLQLSASGLLQARPDYRAVGEHSLEIGVSDGTALVYESRTLTILDDLSASDLGVTLAVERTLWSTDGWVPVSVTLSNLGPRSSVDATLSLAFTGDWTSQDSRCPLDSDLDQANPDTANPDRHSCVLSLTDSTTLIVSVRQATVGSSDLTLTAAHAGFEVQPDNNQARVTLTFSAGNPTTPQYSVPGFGQGQVRALGIANIQGGRWPELLFANGPGEASTSYRFEQSLFHPVLHSHLGDAADSYAMALFDADNDGDIDWVLANGGGEANSVYRNDGNGQFTLVDLLGDADSRAVAFGDVDQDGDIDLVFANLDDPNTLYLNNGDGTFSFYAELGRCRAQSVLIHDFNQDGRPDILFGNHGRRNRLLFNRGFGYHARAAGRGAGRGAGAAADSLDFDTIELGEADDLTDSMSLADFDGDGDASDIVFVNQANSERPASLQIFTVAADEQSRRVVQSQSGSVADISVADYDGDGRDDLALLRPGGALEVMQVQASGLLTIAVLDTDGADTILMVDVDGSGQADLISANNRSANSRLDFVGDDLDSARLNNEDASTEALLPNPLPVGLPEPTTGQSRPSQGGAGLPWILSALILARRKK
ncbi:tandem-95 repeat protein [Reinekea sp.]|uniref:tandem-95 repeat protein n=1 Tax=Reinekea sp. TaxID=1970455 RepID=UPI002A7EAFFD|nr:tandem-95 repeat protein [Reinekea sp.]